MTANPLTESPVIDSHQHFWMLSRGDYGWLDDIPPLRRDFLPDDLRPLLARAGVGRTILVQAAETEAETHFLLEIAERTDFVAGVVGWLDLDDDGFAERLATLSRNTWLVGLRPVLQGLADDRWILRPRVLRSLRHIADSGLAFDILTFTRHLGPVREALERTPGLRAVLDHVSKPEIAAGRLDPWRDEITALAGFPDVACKVSGLVTEASPDWALADLAPYVDHVATAFGEDRLMFGSDWPVATLAATYGEVGNAARALLGRRFGPDAMAKIFGGNAARFYRVEGR